jgi:hypothetical protein
MYGALNERAGRKERQDIQIRSYDFQLDMEHVPARLGRTYHMSDLVAGTLPKFVTR